MRFEFSAGGIVYKPVRQAQGKKEILILVAQHSQHHGWVFPKGLIGDKKEGEKKEETAIREVKEETGIDAKIVKPLMPVTYWFVFSSKGRSASGGKGEKIKKTVYYFLMEYQGGNMEERDKEMEDVKWIPLSEVETKLTYKSDKQVWQEAQKLIE